MSEVNPQHRQATVADGQVASANRRGEASDDAWLGVHLGEEAAAIVGRDER